MLTTKYGYRDYFLKSLKWFLGNFFFGIFPLTFVLALNRTTPGHIGHEELQSLIHGGALLFVSLAMMGAVLVDYLLSGVKLGGFQAFAIYLFPCILLFGVSIQYLLIIISFLPKDIFNLDSATTNIIFTVATFYSTFAKANLYFREDVKNG